MTDRQLFFGSVPVPYTVAWTNEERIFLGPCPYAKQLAMRNPVDRGTGKPRFGSPHMDRQREAIALCLCALCGQPLKTSTKVSLSQAKSRMNAASPLDVLQVEPLLHRHCAAICMEHCPSLKRQMRDGDLNIRQVFRHACQFAIYSAQGVFEACGERQIAISHAKVQLIKWQDRDLKWLEAV